jgi:hypothetical protein
MLEKARSRNLFFVLLYFKKNIKTLNYKIIIRIQGFVAKDMTKLIMKPNKSVLKPFLMPMPLSFPW